MSKKPEGDCMVYYYEKKKIMTVTIREVKRKYRGVYGDTEYKQRLIYVPKQFDDTTDEVVILTKEKAKELGIIV